MNSSVDHDFFITLGPVLSNIYRDKMAVHVHGFIIFLNGSFLNVPLLICGR